MLTDHDHAAASLQMDMADVLNGDGRQSLHAQLQSFKQSDAARDSLLQTIIDDYQKLGALYSQKCDDYENEQTSRRHWQEDVARVKRELASLRQQTDCNPFALVLIDGDGVIFREELLRGGADGGAKAAHLLHNEIRATLEQSLPDVNVSNWSIMCQVFANSDGLSRKLAQVGILDSPQDLHIFARAFSCNQPLFSFVDVGMGKERADHKMKETFRLFLKNIQCKHIIFGGCHDNGYIPNLEPFSQDLGVATRVTLLEATPAERGYHKLGFEITRFNQVFRTDPLPDYPRTFFSPERTYPIHSQENRRPIEEYNVAKHVFTSPSPNQAMHNSSQPPIARATGPSREASSANFQALPGQTATVKPSPGANPLATSYSPADMTANSNQKPTYSKAGHEGDAKVISIASVKAPVRRFIVTNANQHRLDRPLPRADEMAAKNLTIRIKQKKVCNNWHLLGKCSNGDYCQFSHAPKLCPSELAALRSKARERPCLRAGACRDFDCVSGHHCPRGEACDSQWCSYEDPSHYIDMAIKLKEYENGELESMT